MNNILVVNVNWLGDAIFSTPVFKALKQAYPQAKITCLCVPRVKEVLEYCPYVDRIIIYDEKGKHRFPFRKWKLIRHLSRQKFDAAFLLHRSLTRLLMVYLAGIPRRIGYSKAPFFLTHRVDAPAENIHRSDAYLSVLSGMGIKVHDRLCELRLKLDDMQSLDKKLLQAGIGDAEDFIVLNAGGNWDLKRWPPSSFAQLAKRISHDFNLKVILSGGPGDRALCDEISHKSGGACVVFAGETSLGESLALYKRARAVVSSDSGPLHLAHSVSANVVGIYGPTRVEITGPRGGGACQILFNQIECNHAPCYHLACKNNVCMQTVTIDDVAQALQKILC